MKIPKLKLDRFKVLEQFYKYYEKNGYKFLETDTEEFRKATGLNEKEIEMSMDYFLRN